MAVAIIAILASVSFVGVTGYLRSMAQLERDNIAKEIFVAAQNHLAMAEGQNYMGRTERGVEDFEKDENGKVKKKIYYYIVNAGNVTASDDEDENFENGLLGLMLPFGSIDETIRGGGNYVIRYQAEPANVLDVFYSPNVNSGKRFIYPITQDSYKKKVKDAGGEEKKSIRKWFPDGIGDGVIGWYGGGEGLVQGEELKTPDITVINAETLRVEVTDYNPVSTPLQLIITGVTSGAQKAINLRAGGRVSTISSSTSVNTYGFTLDDITDWDSQFRNLGNDNGTPFLPGEDITIQAVAYRNDVLTNVGYSATKKTNSLFAKMDLETETNTDGQGNVTTKILSSTASITNIRHLQNLGKDVSSVNDTTLKLQAANQKTDLSWTAFLTELGNNSAQICLSSTSSEEAGCYHPVNVDYPLAYDGMGHRISDVLIKHNGDKGVFGTYGADSISSIQNLAIVDLKMETSTSGNAGNAGALAGTMENTSVTNVVAYNSSTYETANSSNILTSGAAGGLIGSMSGGSATACAAALYVESDGGNAGGLIGTAASNASVTACYSGGHTVDAQYYTFKDASGNVTTTKTELYNVKGASVAEAGGLIGSAANTSITNSYSTCSVTGGTAGGLIGSGTGDLTNCYATGLVKGTTAEGAFAGTYSVEASGCKYYEIINERSSDTEGYTYLPSVPGSDSERPVAGIEPLDKDAASYNAFTGGTWSDKVLPYDDTLREYYQNKYNLQTVEQLGADLTVPDEMKEYIEEYFVKTHYGDWPAPEIFVINTTS